MPGWDDIQGAIGDITVVQVLIWVLILLLLAGLFKKMWPLFKGLVTLVDAVPTIMKLPTTLEAQDKQISAILHELSYNNETSVKDATHRIELGVKGIYPRLDTIDEKIEGLESEDVRLQGEIDERTQPRPHHHPHPTLDIGDTE